MRFATTLLCLAALACGGTPRDGEVVVFGAASLQDVLRACGAEFAARQGVSPVFNFAGSNVLAQQIVAGARADLFVSADERWMDSVAKAGRIAPGTRTVLAGNTLVLIARTDSPIRDLDPASLASAPIRGLALGDPESVPAGRYAKAALGPVWRDVSDRVIPAQDVRAALALVESDPEIAGIVYRTDAASSPRVRVLHEFPVDAAEPVRYAAAVVRDSPSGEAANAFLDFLRGDPGRAIFARHGFTPPPEAP